jgi:hypothetical protein
VSFVRADVDTAMQEDPSLPEFGWGWFLSALDAAGCTIAAPSGTVTRVSSASFGKLSPRHDESEIEIRASWTPVVSDTSELIKHISGWCTLIAEVAGLEEIPEGVATINSSRAR